MVTTWPFGVVMYIIGALGQAFGANLQRQSFMEDALLHAPDETRTPKKDQPKWIQGLVILVLSGVFMSFSLFFAAQTVVAPMCLFIYAGNYYFAWYLNDEPFHCRTDGVATVIVTTGVVLCLVAAPKSDEDYTQSQLWEDRIVSPTWIIWAVLMPILIFGVITLQRSLLRECGDDPTQLVQWKQTALNMTWGAKSGVMGGVNITFSNMFFSLMVGETDQNGMESLFKAPLFYGLAFLLPITFVIQMFWTVEGLEELSAVIVMASFAVSEMLVAIAGGILCFHDYSEMDAWNFYVFMPGVLVALTGVCLMAHWRPSSFIAQDDQSQPLLPKPDPDKTDAPREDDHSAINGDEKR